MKVELHLLQNFPPANLNRDDTGQPKDTDFGGVRRARVSSQCIKRSIRRSGPFERKMKGRIAKRSKSFHEKIAPLLVEKGHEPEKALQLVAATFEIMLGWDAEKGENGLSSVLYYTEPKELSLLANLIHERSGDLNKALDKSGDARKKSLKSAVKKITDEILRIKGRRVYSADIALFGRMLANVPSLNINAASQVAHAVSTHALDQDFDFYTAVDDLKAGDDDAEDKGAGMVGTTGFNSSCYYRYALVDATQLAANLAEGADEVTSADRALAAEVVGAFLEGAIEAIPSGKQNAFAAQTPPSLVMAVVKGKDAAPWSLANAFATPVDAESEGLGLIPASVKRLDTHWDALVDMYGDGGAQVFVKVAKDAGDLESLAGHAVSNAPAVVQGVADALKPWVEG
ncbi:MAG: type I-E CRISPR-associated protein Cas7/Cse4/CasC [Bacteroidota bacterium]